jgi:hypothetical protein
MDQSIGDLGPVTIAWSSPYPGGRRAVWGSSLFGVFKAAQDSTGGYRVVGRFQDPPIVPLPSGAYTVLDCNGHFFQPKGLEVRRFEDRWPGLAASPLVLANRFTLPQSAAADDAIVGLSLTFDGMLALATEQGVVAVLSRDFSRFRAVTLDAGESISNSIAVSEDGGIFVVTSKRVYRVQWTGTELTQSADAGAWAVDYDPGPDPPAPGRLGPGSGTTPTLMGTGDEDRFVVIADGRELMHILLLWRDAIPPDWEPLAPGKDRRIAAEVPITFGNPGIQRSVTEQSLTVYGYDAMAASNGYNWPFSGDLLRQAVILFSGLPFIQPLGIEKFRWDPTTRTLSSVWSNPSVSVPNGIPCMSSATGLAYCWTASRGQWALSGIDWETGVEVFRRPLGSAAQFNSVYAATEVGPGGTIGSGSLGGPVFLQPRALPIRAGR